jgi:hypothetical protein
MDLGRDDLLSSEKGWLGGRQSIDKKAAKEYQDMFVHVTLFISINKGMNSTLNNIKNLTDTKR